METGRRIINAVDVLVCSVCSVEGINRGSTLCTTFEWSVGSAGNGGIDSYSRQETVAGRGKAIETVGAELSQAEKFKKNVKTVGVGDGWEEMIMHSKVGSARWMGRNWRAQRDRLKRSGEGAAGRSNIRCNANNLVTNRAKVERRVQVRIVLVWIIMILNNVDDGKFNGY